MSLAAVAECRRLPAPLRSNIRSADCKSLPPFIGNLGNLCSRSCAAACRPTATLSAHCLSPESPRQVVGAAANSLNTERSGPIGNPPSLKFYAAPQQYQLSSISKGSTRRPLPSRHRGGLIALVNKAIDHLRFGPPGRQR